MKTLREIQEVHLPKMVEAFARFAAKESKLTPPKYDATYHEGMSILERDATGDEQ